MIGPCLSEVPRRVSRRRQLPFLWFPITTEDYHECRDEESYSQPIQEVRPSHQFKIRGRRLRYEFGHEHQKHKTECCSKKQYDLYLADLHGSLTSIIAVETPF